MTGMSSMEKWRGRRTTSPSELGSPQSVGEGNNYFIEVPDLIFGQGQNGYVDGEVGRNSPERGNAVSV